LRRAARFARTRARELRMIVKALISTKHPILVHIIPIRRCNLACTYCNEFDDVSTPVPLDEMKQRSIYWPTWERRSLPSAAANRCCIRRSTK